MRLAGRDDRPMETGQPPVQPFRLRPAAPARSRSGRWLGRLSLVALVGALVAALSVVGSAYGSGVISIVLPVALLVLASVPLALYLLSALIGPRGAFASFFERVQPLMVVDGGGLTLTQPRQGDRIVVHNEIGGLRSRGLRGGWVLVDRAGGRLIEIPGELLTCRDERTRETMTLASAMTRARPDRYVAYRGLLELQPLRFRLRSPDEPETDWRAITAARRRLQLFLMGFAVVAAGIVGYSILT